MTDVSGYRRHQHLRCLVQPLIFLRWISIEQAKLVRYVVLMERVLIFILKLLSISILFSSVNLKSTYQAHFKKFYVWIQGPCVLRFYYTTCWITYSLRAVMVISLITESMVVIFMITRFVVIIQDHFEKVHDNRNCSSNFSDNRNCNGILFDNTICNRNSLLMGS